MPQRLCSSQLTLFQVDNVTCWKAGKKIEGTLHLMSHHIIFAYQVPGAKQDPADPKSEAGTPKSKELWLTYPMIAYCTYRPSPPLSPHRPMIRLRCRDFTYVAFMFDSDDDARNVYDGIKSLTCIKRGRLDKLYAFAFDPPGRAKRKSNGWDVYNPKKELGRLGISEESAPNGWRITKINNDYKVGNGAWSS
jgi:myotubularin-related protein 6/7/8